jgi:hypothetical protein
MKGAYMKKILLSFCFCLIAASGFSEEFYDFYRSFIEINNAYNGPSALLMEQRMVRISDDDTVLDQGDARSLYNNGKQITKINEKNSDVYFLSTENGFWIKNKNLRTPLKISGNYKVEYMEIQDIFRIDIETDYKIVNFETETNFLLLTRSNNRMVYPFIKIRMINNPGNEETVFELFFLDRNQKPLRRIIYEAGQVNSYYCFKKISAFNLLFNTDAYSVYLTLSVKPVQIPPSLFRETQMNQLILYMENIIQ